MSAGCKRNNFCLWNDISTIIQLFTACATAVTLYITVKTFINKDKFKCNIINDDTSIYVNDVTLKTVLPIIIINEGTLDFSIYSIYLSSDKKYRVEINYCLFDSDIKMPIFLKRGENLLMNIDVDKVYELLGPGGVMINIKTSYGYLKKSIKFFESQIDTKQNKL